MGLSPPLLDRSSLPLPITRNENSCPDRSNAPLRIVLPSAVFVDLIENDKKWLLRIAVDTLVEIRIFAKLLLIRGHVPVEIAAAVDAREEPLGERCLADLARAAHECHLAVVPQDLSDMGLDSTLKNRMPIVDQSPKRQDNIRERSNNVKPGVLADFPLADACVRIDGTMRGL